MHPHRMFFLLLLASLITLSRIGNVEAIGWIGMTIEPPRGVQVGEIIKQGPADQAGLQRGDVIRKVDGQDVLSMEQFVYLVHSRTPGTSMVMTVQRNGKDLEIKAVLEDGWEHQSVAQTPFGRLRPDPVDPVLTGPKNDFSPQAPSAAEWNSGFPGFPRFPRDPFPEFSPPPTWLGIAPVMAQGGVGVMAVASGGPGEKAGLKPGDLIVSINNQALSTPQALVRLLATFKPGEVIEININRAGQSQTVQAKLEAPPTTASPVSRSSHDTSANAPPAANPSVNH
ncbi:MAG: PDZ domain-containing protein [Magnetococcales bacterium]|nr:PDZ domain-containing protein [Magnetococcales bacterium]